MREGGLPFVYEVQASCDMADEHHTDNLNEEEKAALAWFVRLRGAPTRKEREDFARWLAADPAHQAVFSSLETVWSRVAAPSTRLAAEEEAALRRLLTKMDRREKRPEWRRFKVYTVVATASLCLFLLAGGVWIERPFILQDLLIADEVTARGERRLVSLADGSSALLDADSALAIDYSGGARRLTLLRGAAFFSVVAASAPFLVSAADGEVRVYGTQFEVRRSGEDTIVTVSAGKVSVRPSNRPEAILEHRQQLRYGPAGVSPVMTADLDAAFAWRQGRMVFYRARVSEVVEAVGRYYPGRVFLLHNEWAERRITGSFSTDDPEAALTSLQAIAGFRRDTIAGRLVLLR